MVAQFPNVADFHSIANAKLFFYEEHPEEVARLIDRFLGAAARRSRPAPTRRRR